MPKLLSAGTPVNEVLHNELTLLMWAAAMGQDDAVAWLIAQGADKTLKDNRGKTALDMARELGHASTVKLLG